MKQEYMIKNLETGSKTFFFAHSFMSARQHAIKHFSSNKDKFKMKMYRLNTSPFGEKWIDEHFG